MKGETKQKRKRHIQTFVSGDVPRETITRKKNSARKPTKNTSARLLFFLITWNLGSASIGGAGTGSLGTCCLGTSLGSFCPMARTCILCFLVS